MDTTVIRKKENIAPRSHLTLVSIERTPEQLLDLELAEAIVGIETPDGVERPRRFYKVAAGELHPARVIARVIADAIGAHVEPMAIWRAITGPFRRFIERKARRRLPRKRDDKFLPTA